MRSQLFRTSPVLINGANVVVGTFDVDGAEPFTLFLENLDLPATLSTAGLFRSKDANLLFTAVTPGTGGNAITVQFTKAASQAFSIGVVGNAITVNLPCDSAGNPTWGQNLAVPALAQGQALQIMTALNANGPASALITTALALTGGAASAALAQASGAAVEISSSSLPAAQTTANGWVVNTTAGTDLLPSAGTIAANSVAAREFTSGKAPSTAADVAMMRSM